MKIIHALLALSLVMLEACSIAPLKLQGRVLDQKTGAPIAGAVVSASWRLSVGPHNGFAGMDSAAETVTDNSGRFEIPVWRHGWGGGDSASPYITIIKRGYRPFSINVGYERDLSAVQLVALGENPEEDNHAGGSLSYVLAPIYSEVNEDCLWKKVPRTIMAGSRIKAASSVNNLFVYGVENIPVTAACGDPVAFFKDFQNE